MTVECGNSLLKINYNSGILYNLITVIKNYLITVFYVNHL